MDKPSKVNLVELGPGRGTLMSDLLRTAKKFPEFYQALKVNLVEVSPALRGLQAESLGVEYNEKNPTATINDSIPLQWHERFEDITVEEPLLIVGQEFLDCLPVHQFEVRIKE